MVTHTPYENESGMSNVPPETLRALRTFLWTHGITTTIAGLSEILHDFGPNWHDTANQIGSVIGAAPTTSIEERQRLLGNGRIRIGYSEQIGSKINIIKAVRTALDIGLKEAKDYTEEAALHGVIGDLGVLDALNTEMKARGLPERFTMD